MSPEAAAARAPGAVMPSKKVAKAGKAKTK